MVAAGKAAAKKGPQEDGDVTKIPHFCLIVNEDNEAKRKRAHRLQGNDETKRDCSVNSILPPHGRSVEYRRQ